MKTLTASLLLAFSLSATADEFAPLQPAHEGLYFDPLVENVVVQVYPFNEAGFVVINSFDPETEQKDYAVLVYSDFNGLARTAPQDLLLGIEGGPAWTLQQVGDTCTNLVLSQPGLTLNLERVVPSNGLTECYTCPSVAVGPFPPACRR